MHPAADGEYVSSNLTPVLWFDITPCLSVAHHPMILIGLLLKAQVDGEGHYRSGWYRLLIFTDASCGEEVVGLGYVIRVNGQEYTGSTYIEGDYTSMEAEYLALKEAVYVLEWMRETERHIDLYTDCEPLMRKMTQKNGCRKWNERYDEFHELASDYNWELRWTPRKNNREADELASLGLRKGRAAIT